MSVRGSAEPNGFEEVSGALPSRRYRAYSATDLAAWMKARTLA